MTPVARRVPRAHSCAAVERERPAARSGGCCRHSGSGAARWFALKTARIVSSARSGSPSTKWKRGDSGSSEGSATWNSSPGACATRSHRQCAPRSAYATATRKKRPKTQAYLVARRRW